MLSTSGGTATAIWALTVVRAVANTTVTASASQVRDHRSASTSGGGGVRLSPAQAPHNVNQIRPRTRGETQAAFRPVNP
jgi:hypothetical protein